MYAIIISGWQNLSRKYKIVGSKSCWNIWSDFQIWGIYPAASGRWYAPLYSKYIASINMYIYTHYFNHYLYFSPQKGIVINGVRVSHRNTVSVVGWFIVIAFDTSHVANCQCVITNSDLHNEIINFKTQCATFSFIYKKTHQYSNQTCFVI